MNPQHCIGYYEQPAYPVPICPECGSQCEKVYKDSFGFVIGCDKCLEECNADECKECFEEEKWSIPN